MKLSRKQGATSQILQVFLQNSASTTGAGVISLTPGSVGLTFYYHQDTQAGTGVAVTLTTMTIGTYKSGGFGEINSTNMPGMYQICPPDAAFSVTAASVVMLLRGATNMADLPIEIDLDSQVDLTYIAGVPLSTTAAQIGVNTMQINSVSTGSVTTINANQGTTQPLNFTGTAASALVKTDMVDIAGAAVSTTTAQLGTNLVNIAGAAVSTTTAQLGVNLINIAGAAVSTTTAQLGINIVNVAGSPLSVTTAQFGVNLVNISGAANNTGLAQLGVNVIKYNSQTAQTDANNLPKVDVEDISGAAVSTTQAQLGVNVVQIKSVTSAGTAGYAGLDWANINAPTTTQDLSNTTIKGIDGVTFPANVGDATIANQTTINNNVTAVGALVLTRVATTALPPNFTVLSITGGGLVSTNDFITQVTESYRANGAAPTPAQALCEILAHLGEAGIVSVTKTINKFDHTTPAETFTLDSSSAPTSITRAS